MATHICISGCRELVSIGGGNGGHRPLQDCPCREEEKAAWRRAGTPPLTVKATDLMALCALHK